MWKVGHTKPMTSIYFGLMFPKRRPSACVSKNYIMMEIVYYSSGPVTIDLIIIPPMPFEYVHMHAH